jgi:hypothetical protein
MYSGELSRNSPRTPTSRYKAPTVAFTVRGHGGVFEAGVKQRRPDGQVDDVVERVDFENDEVGALRGEKADSGGDRESQEADKQVDGTEDGGDKTVR